ncbi:MAG: hypothetical protein JXA57_13645 [Armatimonadetes bacterium]|nr:hypothetical protein [Armatimonadota bacterium]
MRHKVGALLLLVGLAIGIIGLLALPGGHGRFEYLVEVVDPRPAEESEMSQALSELGAVGVLVLRDPSTSAEVSQVLLLPDLSSRLRNADCALGGLPSDKGWEGLAGAKSGLDRGALTLAGHDTTVTGKLQSLAPLFDQSLVMAGSDEVQQALVEAGWRSQARYLVFSESWGQRAELLDRLDARPETLPTPEARIVASDYRPLLSQAAHFWLSCVLILGGLVVAGLQFRGVSREDLTGRFSQGTAKKS